MMIVVQPLAPITAITLLSLSSIVGIMELTKNLTTKYRTYSRGAYLGWGSGEKDGDVGCATVLAVPGPAWW